jgi:hypothetical protein
MYDWRIEESRRYPGLVFHTLSVGNRKFRVFVDSLGRSRVQFSTFGKNSILVYRELFPDAYIRSVSANMKILEQVIEHIPSFLFKG